MDPLLSGSVAAATTASTPQQPLAPLVPSAQRLEDTMNVPAADNRPPPVQPTVPVEEKPPPLAAPATSEQKSLTALERETALQMMGMLAKYKEADPFRKPVDWEALNIPDYPTIIKQPMDLGTVREKLRSGAYANMDAWKADLALIWANCRKYNGEAHFYSKMAEKLEAALERRMDEAVAAANRELAQKAEASRGGKLKASRELAGLRTSASDDSQDDTKPALPRVGSGARLTNTATRQPDQARMSDSIPGGLKRAASSGLEGAAAGAGNGRAVKRKASNAPGNVVPGVDLDALEQLANTPAARSLGARRPEQLAFLQLWKNLVSSEEAAVAEAEALQQSNKKLKRQLVAAEEQIRELRASLETETLARQAAEEGSKQLRADHAKLQAEHKQQNVVLEHQKQLLEQQQQVIRQVLGQKNQQQQQQQQPQQARPPAPVVHRPEASPGLMSQQQQPAPIPPPAAALQQRPQPQQQAQGPMKIQAPMLIRPRAPTAVQPQQQHQQQQQQPAAQPHGDIMQP